MCFQISHFQAHRYVNTHFINYRSWSYQLLQFVTPSAIWLHMIAEQFYDFDIKV
jgi:hypothetical protein